MATNKEYKFGFVLVNQNKVRLTAFIVMMLSIIYIVTGTWIVPALLIVDFALRAFNKGRYSFLNSISTIIIDFGGIETIPMNEAPKRFAAKIGMLIASAILVSSVTGFPITARIFAGILAAFAFSESVVGFCAGCYIYSFFLKLFNKYK